MARQVTRGVLALIVCVVLFAGVSAQAAAPVKIRFLQMEYDNDVVKNLKEIAAKYRTANSGVDVQIVSLDWPHGHDTLVTWEKGGTLPDAGNVAARWVAEFEPSIEPVTNLIPKDFLKKFPDGFARTGLYRGTQYGLPYFMDTRVLYYRTDLFQKAGLKAPDTLADLKQAALTLTDQAKGIAGYGLDAGDVFFFTRFSVLLWAAAGDYWDRNGNVTVNSPAGLWALTFLNDLVKAKAVNPDYLAAEEFGVDKAFLAGNVGMWLSGSWLFNMIDGAKKPVPYAMVQFPKDKRRATLAAPDLAVIFKTSKHKKETAAFVQFLYRADIRKDWLKRRGAIPDTFEVIKDPYFAGNPKWKPFLDAIPFAHQEPITKTTNRLQEEVKKMGQSVFLGRKTPQQALQDLETVMKTLAKP